MIVHGLEYLGLGFIVSLVVLYAIVLGAALAITATRRLVYARRGAAFKSASAAVPVPTRRA